MKTLGTTLQERQSEIMINKKWVKLGKMNGAPDGTFYMDKVKYTTDPATGDVWAFISHSGRPDVPMNRQTL